MAHYSSFLLCLVLTVSFAATAASATTSPTNSSPAQLDPVMVFGSRTSVHDVTSESDLVGPAHQPEWTTRRAFAETDVYVIPPGEIEINQYYISSHSRHGKPLNDFESEFEFGLPWRTQFDVEPEYGIEDGKMRYHGTRLELPHALANWGKIPLNPTIDGGWRFREGEADSFLFRLLLAEQFGERWHFAANLGFEQQVGGERETEYELNAALSYVVMDRKLTIGAELLIEHERDDEESSLTAMLGPTFLYKPSRDTHLGLVPLFGVSADAPVAEIFLIFGIDLEPFTWGHSSSDSSRDFQPVRRSR
jgi:hypothetical protein